jgi:malonyl-CoA O-methyltransferase
MSESGFRIDQRRMRAHFDRAASDYDRVAVLQREVGQRVFERLDVIRLQPKRILDVGCGTGLLSAQLSKRFRDAEVVSLDISTSMLHQARRRKGWFRPQRFVCGDAERLPIATASVDMVFSNLTLQWCNDLEGALRECARVLRPGGVLLYSTLGPDTLRELRESWRAADAYNHVNAFYDMHDIGDAMMRAALAEPVMDVERLTLTYPTVTQLMADLKHLGARNATAGRARGLTGKRRLNAMIQAYESYRKDGVLPATYEVVYGHAWGGTGKQPRRDGVSAAIPLDELRRRIRS